MRDGQKDRLYLDIYHRPGQPTGRMFCTSADLCLRPSRNSPAESRVRRGAAPHPPRRPGNRGADGGALHRGVAVLPAGHGRGRQRGHSGPNIQRNRQSPRALHEKGGTFLRPPHYPPHDRRGPADSS
eukprot:scaffold194680_cov39-Prasinocladus_malaysianus.AAC.2